MITNLILRAGRTSNADGEAFSPTPMTVFVGPNNSGKSKLLREIEQFSGNGPQLGQQVLEALQFAPFSAEEAARTLEEASLPPLLDEMVSVGKIIIGNSRIGRIQIERDQLLRAMQNPQGNLEIFCAWFARLQTLILDGNNRMNLVNDQTGGDLQLSPQNSLQVLYKDNKKRQEVRRIIQEAFSSFYYVIDPTNLGQLRIRFAPRLPINEMEEKGVHDDAIRFHGAALLIAEASDGVKAFTGMVTEIWAGDPKIILVDEPEAFLHPTLSTKLGLELSKAAVSTKKQIFASTHSAAFLMGCIQSGAQLNIARLTYRDQVATSRILPSEEILQLMRNPLLRSTGVLNGLFHEFVVITEGDSDRAFYEEINERLLRFKPEWGIPNCLFINAQNKQTIRTIMKPLRKLGIPAVGIFDVDVVKDGGKDFTELLDAAGVPAPSHGSLQSLRNTVKGSLENKGLELEKAGTAGKDMSYNGGIFKLDKANKETADNLMNQLAEYGIFCVRNGTLESWLKDLGVAARKSEWLVATFERMGEDPDSEGYTKPYEDDVWKFMSIVKTWLFDSERKGIPD